MLLEKQMLEAASWTNPGVREFKEDANAEPEIAANTVDLVRVFRDILDRARQAAMIVIHDKGFPRLTPDTIAALAKIAKIDQQQSRYTIYRR